MECIQFIQKQPNSTINHTTVDECYKLRHKVFNERLNWDVMSRHHRESDIFDNDATWYAILKDHNNHVVGTWRALPTTGDYMLKSVFPALARGETIPKDEKIWEISRFAIDKTKRTIPRDGNYICEESEALVQSFYDFAYSHDINQLVAVTSVAAERMMKSLGVKLRRLGDGKSMLVGNVRSTAILIDIPARTL